MEYNITNRAVDFFNRLMEHLGLEYSIEPYDGFIPCGSIKQRLVLNIRDPKGRYNNIHFASRDDDNAYLDDILIDFTSKNDSKKCIEKNILDFLIKTNRNSIVCFETKTGKFKRLFSFPMFDSVPQVMITLDTTIGS